MTWLRHWLREPELRIALRTSGGRGEYELAGHQGAVRVDDLLEHNLVFELTPEIKIDGHAAAHRVQGKPRIRLEDPSSYSHAYSFLAASLLLPQPKRALKETATESDFIRDGQYAISDIDVDVAGLADAAVDLRPTTLWLRNASNLARSVDVPFRMALVQSIWDTARDQDSAIAVLVRAHETAVLEGGHREIKAAATGIQEAFEETGDVLGELTARLGMEDGDTAISTATEKVSAEGIEDEVDPADAARRAVAQWRKGVIRSAQGRAFSQRVRVAYGNRCALSGDTLPKLGHTASAGVDGAHILPWARYELNTVSNGICLNKLCHWAFDAGVIRIDFDSSIDGYRVSIPERVRDEAPNRGMSLDYFASLEGSIPTERLPADPSQRPSANYLERLNAELYG
jgi:hypothetical protein